MGRNAGGSAGGVVFHPELLIYPGICIFIAAAGFNLFGEALRDILQPQEDVL
jgi:peptide/nickel transport system permease protein